MWWCVYWKASVARSILLYVLPLGSLPLILPNHNFPIFAYCFILEKNKQYPPFTWTQLKREEGFGAFGWLAFFAPMDFSFERNRKSNNKLRCSVRNYAAQSIVNLWSIFGLTYNQIFFGVHNSLRQPLPWFWCGKKMMSLLVLNTKQNLISIQIT